MDIEIGEDTFTKGPTYGDRYRDTWEVAQTIHRHDL